MNTTTTTRRAGLFTTTLLTNKQMNADVYAKRREVIALVYEAKRLVPNLPRINVRITDDDKNVLGCARRGENTIWITESYVASRHVVFHEILHAVYSQSHVTGCLLMGPSKNQSNPSDATLNQLFRKYAMAIR